MTKPKAPEDRKPRGRPRKRRWPSLSNRTIPVARTVLDPGPGAPLKWDSGRYMRLLMLYASARIKERMKRGEALQILAVIEDIGSSRKSKAAGRNPKKVEERIREARADAKKYGWGTALPEWAKPALSPRFKPTPD